MKQLYIQAPTQHPKNIEDAFSVKNQSNIRRNSNRLAILNPKQPGGVLDTDNREWKGTGLCKGPPGRPRSPGITFPEHPPAPTTLDRRARRWHYHRQGFKLCRGEHPAKCRNSNF